jgi:hypothetical protein
MYMRNFRFVAIVLLIGPAALIGQPKATKQAASPTYPVWWSPELKLKSLADIPARMKQAFSKDDMDELSEGHVDAPTPHNCEELLRTADAQPDNVDGYRTDEWGELGVQCAALRALKTAVPAKRSFVHDLRWTVQLFSLLPAASAWGSDIQYDEELRAAQQKGFSIREFWPKAKYTAHKSGDLQQDENGDDPRNVVWWAGYEKYASGDFTGDGLDEILMWTAGGSRDNPAARRDYLYLLTRTAPGPNTKLTLLQRLY